MKKVLLIIDPQNGFKNKHTDQALKRIDEIIDYFDVVFASKFRNLRGSLYKKLLHWNHFSANKHKEYSDLTIKQTPKMKILNTHTYGKVTFKFRLYCWLNKIDTVYVCGLQTDAGVYKTALDLFDANIAPVVIKDAIASCREIEYHEAGIKLIERQIGEDQVLTFEELKDKLEPKVVELF